VSQEPATAPTLAALRRARQTQDQVWRWMRVLGPLLTVLAAFAIMRTFPLPSTSGRGLLVTASLAGFVLGAFGTIYRQHGTRAHGVAAAVLVLGAITLVWTQSNRTGFIALFVALFLLARRLPTRPAITLSAVAVAFLVLAAATTQRQSTFSALLTSLTIAGFSGLTMLTQRLHEANEQAEQQLDELDRTRAAETRAAALAERQHLAREMHDVLAHSLAGLMLQLEGARLLAREHSDDPRLPEAIERAHRLGKSGLDEARRAIEMLRGDELPGPDGLAVLARRCAEDLGIPCRLDVHGEPVELGSQARLALYRAAQEALTNIAKHAASPERVELGLRYAQDGATLTVEDFSEHAADAARAGDAAVSAMSAGAAPSDPTLPPDAALSGAALSDLALPDADEVPGYGLTGMRERAELLGGSLEAAPTATGFLVRLRVPA
jgi:signal transduction histidine kinase